MNKEITIGSLIYLKPLSKVEREAEADSNGWKRRRHMSAEPYAVAIATSEPYISKTLKYKMVDVMWVDKKAHNQSDGGYRYSNFAPITGEMKERINYGKKDDKYATVHIASLAHFFMLASKGLKQYPAQNM